MVMRERATRGRPGARAVLLCAWLLGPAVAAAADLQAPADMAPPADLRPPPDLAPPPDLRPPPDLAPPPDGWPIVERVEPPEIARGQSVKVIGAHFPKDTSGVRIWLGDQPDRSTFAAAVKPARTA